MRFFLDDGHRIVAEGQAHRRTFSVHQRQDRWPQFRRIVRLLVIVPFREGAHRSDGGAIFLDHALSPHEGFTAGEIRAKEARFTSSTLRPVPTTVSPAARAALAISVPSPGEAPVMNQIRLPGAVVFMVAPNHPRCVR